MDNQTVRNPLLMSERWEQMFGHKRSLPEVCLNLHMGTNGSADEWCIEDVKEAICLLKWWLAVWKKGLPASRKFDCAVRAMAKATMQEAERFVRANITNTL